MASLAVVALVCLVGLLASPAAATFSSVYLSPFGDDTVGCGYTADSACKTFSFAMTQASDGATIFVGPGYYYGQANFPNINMNLNVVGYSVSAQQPAVFDAQEQSGYSSIYINGTATAFSRAISVTFRGLVFQNWYSNYNGFLQMNTDSSSSLMPTLTVHSCTFKNVRLAVNVENGNVLIDNTYMAGDGSYSSYGISVPGRSTSTHQVNLVLSNVTIYNFYYGIWGNNLGLNLAMSQSHITGATNVGMQISAMASARIDNSRIDFCTSGIVLAAESANVVTTLTNTFFSNIGTNFNNENALVVYGKNEVRIKACTFNNNTAGTGRGAGIYCDNYATVTVQSSSFINNQANDGAAAWCNTLCAFNGASNYLYNNVQSTDTGPCNGLTPSSREEAEEARQQHIMRAKESELM